MAWINKCLIYKLLRMLRHQELESRLQCPWVLQIAIFMELQTQVNILSLWKIWVCNNKSTMMNIFLKKPSIKTSLENFKILNGLLLKEVRDLSKHKEFLACILIKWQRWISIKICSQRMIISKRLMV